MVLRPRHGLSLCAGGGGLDMGLMLAEPGFHTRCYVEWEEYPRSVIIAAQRAGYFAPSPIWDDITTFDGRPFRGAIDTILAGYPCQPFSQAGQRRGEDDERHLWPDVARIIREVEPEWVFLENVAGHVSLGAETVLRELWDMGWTPAAGLFSASETGAPHERLRWFCVAHRERGTAERQRPELAEAARDSGGEARQQRIWADARDGSDRMADADGRNAGTERQQRGGELGFQPEGGGTGAGDVVHAECSERWSNATEGDFSDRDDAGRNQAASRAGKSDAVMDHSASARCDAARKRTSADSESGECLSGTGCEYVEDAFGSGAGGGEPQTHQQGRIALDGRRTVLRRGDGPLGADGLAADGQGDGAPMGNPAGLGRGEGWAEHGVRIGRDTAPGSGGTMADASEPRPEGREQRRSSDKWLWSSPSGSTAERGRPLLHPPGPADMGRWADVLVTSPDLAPSASFGDLASFAGQVAAMAQAGLVAEAEIEPSLRRMADGLALRSRALRLLGNGVHPLAAGHAWRTLSAAHGLRPLDLVAARDGDSGGAD